MTDHDFFVQTDCLQCSGQVTLRQPADHSEYAPCGTCPDCGAVHAIPGYLNNDWTVLLIDQGKKTNDK
jgi:hypothetical protein